MGKAKNRKLYIEKKVLLLGKDNIRGGISVQFFAVKRLLFIYQGLEIISREYMCPKVGEHLSTY